MILASSSLYQCIGKRVSWPRPHWGLLLVRVRMLAILIHVRRSLVSWRTPMKTSVRHLKWMRGWLMLIIWAKVFIWDKGTNIHSCYNGAAWSGIPMPKIDAIWIGSSDDFSNKCAQDTRVSVNSRFLERLAVSSSFDLFRIWLRFSHRSSIWLQDAIDWSSRRDWYHLGKG